METCPAALQNSRQKVSISAGAKRGLSDNQTGPFQKKLEHGEESFLSALMSLTPTTDSGDGKNVELSDSHKSDEKQRGKEVKTDSGLKARQKPHSDPDWTKSKGAMCKHRKNAVKGSIDSTQYTQGTETREKGAKIDADSQDNNRVKNSLQSRESASGSKALQNQRNPEKIVRLHPVSRKSIVRAKNENNMSSDSECGIQNSDRAHLKMISGAPTKSSESENMEERAGGVIRHPQAGVRETGNKVEVANGRIGRQKGKVSDPVKNKKYRFSASFTKATAEAAVNPDAEQKDVAVRGAGIKAEISDQDNGEGKGPRGDSTGGEIAALSVNRRAADKSFEPLFQPKATHGTPKSFESSVLSQLVAKGVMSLKNGQSMITIKLKPKILGHLRMHIKTENHHVMIKIMTEAPGVKEIVENNFNQLRNELQSHGLQVDRFDVSVDSNSHQDRGTPPRFPYPEIGHGSGDEEEQSHERSPEPYKPAGIHATSINTDQAIDYFA